MFDWVEICKESVRRIEAVWMSWELQGVCYENCNVFDWVEICKEFVRRIVVCLIKLRSVGSLLGEL